ncbi:hypothetical protein GCM10012289_07970 [Nonomuraea cavernae]|uniref:Uncharacterized protein n=1 Tax=Nonomuraea cavernae TaxID=2045107 RepID=A0A918DFF1_9ACTN|nr:hypothetical protein GCM10012289_07970 [Nonomuraea cavernae]
MAGHRLGLPHRPKSGDKTYKPSLRYEFVRDMAYVHDEYVTVLSTPARGCARPPMNHEISTR